MSKQVNSEHIDQEPTPSGLLLSIEPLQGSAQYSAALADDTDTDSEDAYPGDQEDASDDATDGTEDADGTDNEADSDESD
jgi:hypothetical protein